MWEREIGSEIISWNYYAQAIGRLNDHVMPCGQQIYPLFRGLWNCIGILIAHTHIKSGNSGGIQSLQSEQWNTVGWDETRLRIYCGNSPGGQCWMIETSVWQRCEEKWNSFRIHWFGSSSTMRTASCRALISVPKTMKIMGMRSRMRSTRRMRGRFRRTLLLTRSFNILTLCIHSGYIHPRYSFTCLRVSCSSDVIWWINRDLRRPMTQ